MRWLEIRRHAYTKKGDARGRGSHLSQEGVELARRVGSQLGPFDFVAASLVPRTTETAIAMGFAVDVQWDMDEAALAKSRNEIPRHEQWRWEKPFSKYAEHIRRGGAVAELAELQVRLWRRAANLAPDGGRALVVGHGGQLECGLVACFPDADHDQWGAPFRHCDGASICYDGATFTKIVIRRAEVS